MDFFLQGFPLGRWFRIDVTMSWMFLALAAIIIIPAGRMMPEATIFVLCMVISVILHEFGHALSCLALRGEARYIVLAPWGGLAFVSPPNHAWAHMLTTACGPLVNLVLGALFWGIGQAAQPGGFLGDFLADMYFVNLFLLAFNLLPAWPLDGGRLAHEILWVFLGYNKALKAAGIIGMVTAAAMVVYASSLFRIQIPLIGGILGRTPAVLLIGTAIFTGIQSLRIFQQASSAGSWRKR